MRLQLRVALHDANLPLADDIVREVATRAMAVIRAGGDTETALALATMAVAHDRGVDAPARRRAKKRKAHK